MCEIQNLRTEFKANPGQNENDRFFEIDVKGLSFSYRNDGGHSEGHCTVLIFTPIRESV